MKTKILFIFILLVFQEKGCSQTDASQRLIEELVTTSHGMDYAHSNELKRKVDKVLNNIQAYQSALENYIKAVTSGSEDDKGEALRKGQNAMYLLANANSSIGLDILKTNYTNILNKMDAVDQKLMGFSKEDRGSKEALATRRQMNNLVGLRRYTIDCFKEKKSPALQSTILGNFKKMDYSTQLLALRYLSEVRSNDATFERKKFDTLKSIYDDKGQPLYKTEFLKNILDKQ